MIVVHSYVPYFFVSAVFGWALALVFTKVSISVAHSMHVMAHPDHRSSHSFPTPRLGGLGIVGAFYLHVVLLDARGFFQPTPWKSAVLVGGMWAFVGGLVDDLLQLDPRWKFLFQFAAAASAVALGFVVLPTPLVLLLPEEFGDATLEILAAAFTVLFIVFFMNVFNFMDGMDGQAATFGALATCALALPAATFSIRGTLDEIVILGTLAGALLGFFYFNRPTAPLDRKTFMGDCGSQFVGFVLALSALQREVSTPEIFDFFSALIALSPFLWDASYTLVRRLLRGENILQAHRTHLYQRLLVAGWSHAEVLALNFAVWAAAFVLAQLHGRLLRAHAHSWLFVVYCAVVLVLLLYTLFVLGVERRAAARRAQLPGTATPSSDKLSSKE